MKAYRLIFSVLFTLFALGSFAQQEYKVEGIVIGSNKKPVANAVVTIAGVEETVITDSTGKFSVTKALRNGEISVKANGYYTSVMPLANRTNLKVLLIPRNKTHYNEEVLHANNMKADEQSGSAVNIAKKDFITSSSIEEGLKGQIAGLRVTSKGGMPGEGAYFNFRGVRSLVANNQPLVVINGIPYLPDTEVSPIIGGYSRGLFNNYDINDIANITVLKGAEASLYGSLGSNGVILIETDGASSEDLNTRITFSGSYGMHWNDRTIPMLNRNQYRSYINDIGMTSYTDMEKLAQKFPFLNDEERYDSYLYSNNTKWQDEIYNSSFFTDNVLRIEGGDAIAKYDISLGYMKNGGILGNTNLDRYHTQINTNITVSRKFEIFSTVGLAYSNADLLEQGMVNGTNPILEAYAFAPVFSPYVKEKDGSFQTNYTKRQYDVSNPLALVNTMAARSKVYDVNIRAGLKYRPIDELTFTGTFGLFYNYNKESVFIPGKTSQAIIPLNDGIAENTARDGVGETINMYYAVNGLYSKIWNKIHAFNAGIGFQALTSRKEYDAGSGYNSANDFYQTLEYVTDGEAFFGYINLWNWMNMYGHADYTYKSLIRANVNVAIDGASSVGKDATRFTAYPSVGLTFMAKNLHALANSTLLNRLDVRAEYGLTGNSRFSSTYAKNYYQSTQFMELAGIVRSTVPNTSLKSEAAKQLNIGADIALLSNRIDLSVDYYNTRVNDIVLAQPASSSVYGSANYYNNAAEIENAGVELSLRASLIRTKNFDWVVGGNIAFHDSQIRSLGTLKQAITTLPDGGEVVTRLGEHPYSFYGYQTEGIFSTQAEANAAGLVNTSGQAFNAGDVHFVDRNNDGIINEEDKTVLGKATPDYSGGFYTSLRYRNWSVGAEFTYSFGNDAYNAVRRNSESMSNWDNQTLAVINRWRFDGHVSNVPRAVYGDPMNNSRFSDRWIEDASFIKLRSVTLAYTINRPVFKFIRSAQLYVSAENLYTWTDYLGMDPEFAYSYSESSMGCDYAKVILPRSVKFGFNLKF